MPAVSYQTAANYYARQSRVIRSLILETYNAIVPTADAVTWFSRFSDLLRSIVNGDAASRPTLAATLAAADGAVAEVSPTFVIQAGADLFNKIKRCDEGLGSSAAFRAAVAGATTPAYAGDATNDDLGDLLAFVVTHGLA